MLIAPTDGLSGLFSFQDFLMYLEAREKGTDKLKGYRFFCHGCGDVSGLRKSKTLPPRWVEKTELHYNHQGLHPRKGGFVVNYYCYVCHSDGVSARTVAATTRKFYRRAKTAK